MISFSAENANRFIDNTEIGQMAPQVRLAHDLLHKKTGPGNDYLGWLDLPRALSTRRNSPGSARRPPAFAAIRTSWWSSASAAHTWAPGRRSKC